MALTGGNSRQVVQKYEAKKCQVRRPVCGNNDNSSGVEGFRYLHFCQMNRDLKDLDFMSLRKMIKENFEMNICKMLSF